MSPVQQMQTGQFDLEAEVFLRPLLEASEHQYIRLRPSLHELDSRIAFFRRLSQFDLPPDIMDQAGIDVARAVRDVHTHLLQTGSWRDVNRRLDSQVFEHLSAQLAIARDLFPEGSEFHAFVCNKISFLGRARELGVEAALNEQLKKEGIG